MKISLILVLLLILVNVTRAQSCLNHNKVAVDWFLILKTPSSVSKGYLYYDSAMGDQDLTYYQDQADSVDHPISNTFDIINNNSLNIIAWNDKAPNGTTSSSKAHSKNIIAYNSEYEGIVMIHSMPGYPIIEENKINRIIDSSQNIYGQHFFCFTAGNYTKEILQKSIIINPFIYANTNSQILPYPLQKNLFQTMQFTIGETNIKSIYKNGRSSNGSIFQDGITKLLTSDLIAETWGRPYQEKWCGSLQIPYSVGNSKGIYHSSTINWKQTQDHSKWAIATSPNIFYICLGDMNRMTSQWRRGGTFTCIQSKSLHQALIKKLIDPQSCSENK